jgi:hypothetical protein
MPRPYVNTGTNFSFSGLVWFLGNRVIGTHPDSPCEEMVSMSTCPTGGDHDWILGDDRKFQCAKCGAQSARRF